MRLQGDALIRIHAANTSASGTQTAPVESVGLYPLIDPESTRPNAYPPEAKRQHAMRGSAEPTCLIHLMVLRSRPIRISSVFMNWFLVIDSLGFGFWRFAFERVPVQQPAGRSSSV